VLDLLIRGGRVIDGSGAPVFAADVAVAGNRVYVRELGVLTWEQAVRKMTSLPAARLGFGDRGLVRPGMYADITCIDPVAVRDTATYEQPRSLPEGIPYVLVNGRFAVDGGRRTEVLAGRALRGRKVSARNSASSTHRC